MKKIYPASCDNLPEHILEKLKRVTKTQKCPIKSGWAEIYDYDYESLSKEDKLIVSLKGIKIRRKINFLFKSTNTTMEIYTSDGFDR